MKLAVAVLLILVVAATLPMDAAARPHLPTTEFSNDLPAPPQGDGPTEEYVKPVDGATVRISWSGTANRSWRDTYEGHNGEDGAEGSSSKSFSGVAILRYSGAEERWKTADASASITDNYQTSVWTHCADGRIEKTVMQRQPIDNGAWSNPVDLDFSLYVYRRIADGSYYLHWSGTPIPPVTYQWNSKKVDCVGGSYSNSSQGSAAYYAAAANPTGDFTLEGDDTGTKFTEQYSRVVGETHPETKEFTVTITRLPSSADVRQQTELAESSTFLPGVPLINRLDTELSCKGGSECTATRELRNQGALVASERLGPVAESGKFPKDLDIGTLPPGKTLVSAQGRADGESAPDTKTIQVAERLPKWAQVLGILARKVDSTAVYSGEFKYPEPPAKGKVRIPAELPLPFGLAGNEIGLDDTQAGVKLEVSATGEGELEGGGKTGFVVAGDVVGGELNFGMKLTLDEKGLRASDGTFKLKIYGKIEKKEPLVKVIPATNAILGPLAQISPAAAIYLGSLADLGLEIEPSMTFGLELTEDGFGEIVFKKGDVEPGFGIKAMMSIQPKDFLKILIGIGGEIKSQFEAPPFKLKQIQAKLQAYAEITVYRWMFNPSAAYSWSYPGGAGLSASAYLEGQSGDAALWLPADRSYLNQADYGLWTAPALAAATVSAQANDVELAANVYPRANPALAVLAGRRFLVWSHDRPDAPAQSGGEIAAATSPRFGSAWTPVAPATTDDRDDYSRQVLLVPGMDRGVAVWERFDTATPGDPNSDPNAYLSHVQVAAAVVTPTTGTWGPPVQLSTSGFLNNRPQLGATSTGALAVWIGNAGNQIVGDAAKPDTIFFSRYTASTNTWTAPAAVPGSPLSGLLETALATAGGRAALVYTQDLDGDFATEADHELFSVLWDGTAWSTPTRLTNNSVTDDRPRIVLTTTGAPRFVWRHNGHLKFLDGTWDVAAAGDLPLAGAADGADLRLVQAPDRTLALTWQQPDARETRVGYAVYDVTNNIWGTAQTLEPPVTGTVTGTTTMATNITSALENGRLLIAYQLATVEPTTVTVDGIAVPNVPRVGSTSLRYVEVPLGRNLTIRTEDITILPANAAPGEPVTVSAAIHNTGELAVPAARVDLTQSIQPTVLISQTVGPIRAGETVTATLTVPQPALRDRSFDVVVDPDRRVYEVDETDNKVAILPKVSLSPLTSETSGQAVHVRAQVQPAGGLATSEMLTASLRLDNPAGRELATTVVALPVTPTQSILPASSVITTGQLGPGRHRVAWVLESGVETTPSELTENGTTSVANVLPDLTAAAESITFGRDPGSAAPLSLWVQNHGNWASSGGRVAVYDRDPAQAGAQQLTSLPLPEIAAGGLVTLTGTLPAGVLSLYLQIDPDRAIDELNENNNLLRAGTLGVEPGASLYRVYLPAAQRQSVGW